MSAGPAELDGVLFMSSKPSTLVHSASAVAFARHFLSNTAVGLGGVALAWLLSPRSGPRRGIFRRAPHFAPRAETGGANLLLCGVSHLDTFDYKPELERFHGKTLEGKGENLGFFGQPGK
jgi:hypothetical protein